MANRHKHREDGGKVDSYTATPNKVEEEAEERKKGGKVHRKKGGAMHHMEGKEAMHRMDRPGRKRGGSVGADMHPLSSAAKETGGREEPEAPEDD